MPAIAPPPPTPHLPAPSKPHPTFTPPSVSVIFVLGGPGAGKGTQSAFLVRDYGFTHLSAGDLLRAEQDRPDSQFGGLIREYIRDGRIVPMEVTVQLLENAMTEEMQGRGGEEGKGKGRFLIDGLASPQHNSAWLAFTPSYDRAISDAWRLTNSGFPRKMDQALKFEESVCPSLFTLFFDCPEGVMQERLLNRGKTSGRADDNAESIKKRFRTFEETSMPVVEYFEKLGKVVRIPASSPPERVYEDVKRRMGERGFEVLK